MRKTLAALALGLAALPYLSGAALAHGCHRDVHVDRYGPHLHAGPYCERVDIPPPPPPPRYERHHHHDHDDDDDRRAPVCVKKCHYVGPFKQCDTICR